MRWEPIVKSPGDWKVAPNVQDYEQARAAFYWGEARRELNGLPGGLALNIAHEAIDRHAAGERCLPFHDNWWQTETGGIMLANYAATDIRPGSMGRPLPGIEAAIVHATEDGHVRAIDEPDVQGELALRPGWPSMFRAYWND